MIFRYFNYQQNSPTFHYGNLEINFGLTKVLFIKKTERDILNITQEDGAKPVQNLIQCSEIIFLFPEASRAGRGRTIELSSGSNSACDGLNPPAAACSITTLDGINMTRFLTRHFFTNIHLRLLHLQIHSVRRGRGTL